MRLLIVEDETSLQGILVRRFAQEGYGVDSCDNGDDALGYIRAGSYDCIVLDIMLPEVDGLTVLKTMRNRRDNTPVLLLTAKDGIMDRVDGLDAGADDYLVKPFAFDELSARIRAMLRRKEGEKNTVLRIADLEMNIVTKAVSRGEKDIELTAREYALLEYFLRNPGHVLTRSQITEHVWNFDFDCDSNVVDVYVRYLRRKIDYDYPVRLIHTVRGTGYVLKEQPV
jgi:DNA-binding response OmpR family regulator